MNQQSTIYSNNIVSSIKMNSVKFAERKALICGDQSVSWAEMWSRTNQLGQALCSLGVQKGDRVALILNNCIEFSESFVMCAKFGFIVTPMNRNLKAKELAYHLQDSGAKVVITNPEYAAALQSVRNELPSLEQMVVTGTAAGQGDHAYEQLINEGADKDPDVEISPDDIQMILYTSGTTGRPKGGIRGYKENYHTGVGVCIEWKIRSGDVQLAITPLYHAAPIAWFIATMITGGTYVILPQFNPEAVFVEIEKHKVNWLMAVPVMFDHLIAFSEKKLAGYDLSSLRTLISGGAPLHTRTKVGIKRAFSDSELYEFYGSTELGVSTSLRDEDQLRKERCVGLPMPDVELSIRNDEGDEVQQGEIGLLYSRGLSGFRGYWNAPEKTEEAFLEGGWATVGDMARQDDEGYYYIVDRKKDMIITGGVNVYPVEIEEIIHEMEEVQDVAVIGVPDPKWGEAVKAIIVLHPNETIDENDVIVFCKKRLASFKVPKSVDFVSSIPRTQSGKILKGELRKAYWSDSDFQIS
ncbi:hypothetical protein DCC39_11185 [Pueribacillus theae]|uniref:Long-chain fatty acid--CoA ligase n=1 Tax=Pueribacillus theae TaxID=2171751 RepID=A0A2U1JYT8_9BACI|nr:class I adenylate-forming enzyme family protein [Pueribacillus theae]PWA10390.1 hypothetical protein DCC39_11185 [Pueribacillus theae]